MPRRPESKKHRSAAEPTAARVGARIRKLREEADFGFDAFVGESGIGRGYLSELERGLVVPTVAKLAIIADALEVTIADLVLGDSPREQVMELTRGMTDREVQDLLRWLREGRGG